MIYKKKNNDLMSRQNGIAVNYMQREKLFPYSNITTIVLHNHKYVITNKATNE